MNAKSMSTCPLAQAFVDDHRLFTRGLRDLQERLQADDVPGAVEVAERLDRQGGAHIEFEEHFLYPRVSEKRGEKFVSKLLDEHRVGQETLKQVLSLKGQPTVEDSQREQLLQGAQIAFDHATACGTLLSHLTTLDEPQQSALLAKLSALRRTGRRWTQLA